MLHVSFERLTSAALCNLGKYVRYAWDESGQLLINIDNFSVQY